MSGKRRERVLKTTSVLQSDGFFVSGFRVCRRVRRGCTLCEGLDLGCLDADTTEPYNAFDYDRGSQCTDGHGR